MAVDMFLKIAGIPGESGDEKHAKDIDVLAWSFGASQSGTMHMGGGGGAGKVSFGDLSITKYVDASSPKLIQSCAKGKHITKAELFVRKAGDTPLEYMIYTMEDLLVSSYSTGGSGGEDRLTENVSLNFRRWHFEYVVQKEDGSGGDKHKFGYDIAKNVDWAV